MWKHHHQPPLLVSQPLPWGSSPCLVALPIPSGSALPRPERGDPAIRAVAGAPQQRSLRPAGTPGARLGSEPWKSDGKISESGDLIRENRDFQWEIYWKWPCRSWVNHLEIWYFFHGYVKLPTGNHKKWWFNWQQLSFFTLQNWEVQHFVTHKSARYSGM